MLDRLPVLINPVSFSERGKKLTGPINVSDLSRLSDALVDDSGVVNIDFSFDKEGRRPILEGVIKANLMLQCQACLKPVEWSVERRFKLGFVISLEQADKLPGDCEPLLLDNESISLNELVEDELILALPDFPRHKEECITREESVAEVKEDNETQLDPNNPFSVLAEFKNTGD